MNFKTEISIIKKLDLNNYEQDHKRDFRLFKRLITEQQ